MNKKLVFLIFLLQLSRPTQSINSEYIKNVFSLDSLKSASIATAVGLLAFYTINPAVANLHELGHALSAKLLFNASWPRITLAFWPWNNPSCTYGKGALPKSGVRLAVMHAAGVAVGLLSIYSLAKLSNIGYHYYATHSLIEALSCGLAKPIFNADQYLTTKIVYGALIANQLANFIPIKWHSPNLKKTTKSDGYYIGDALGIFNDENTTNNPALKKIPEAIQFGTTGGSITLNQKAL